MFFGEQPERRAEIELNTPPHPQAAPLLVKNYDTVQAEAAASAASAAIGCTTRVLLLLRECCAYCVLLTWMRQSYHSVCQPGACLALNTPFAHAVLDMT